MFVLGPLVEKLNLPGLVVKALATPVVLLLVWLLMHQLKRNMLPRNDN
jgi:hypothetical protein